MAQTLKKNPAASELLQELGRLKELYHSKCMFTKASPVAGLTFEFQDNGMLSGVVTFGETHQSYDERVHGGLVAAIIDASMTQCLMGHSVIAYTVDLNIRYHAPVNIHEETVFETTLLKDKRGQIFELQCLVKQADELKVKGISRFFGKKEGR